MHPGRLNGLVRHLNDTPPLVSDAELLTRFVQARDGEAFAALVRRHGRMVFGVCQRALRDEHAAEDAFQATFLVLARRAHDVRPRRLLANWLYGVAHRTALEARRAMATRRAKERRAAELAGRRAGSPDDSPDLRPLLDRELAALPERYRAPVVLCDLEGLTRREAARRLGWAEGTLSGRLFRARALLARRLARYGLSVASGAVAAAFAEGAGGLPGEALLRSTVQAVLTPAASASAAALLLTQGVMKTMLFTKLKAMTACLMFIGLCLGVGAVYRASAGEGGSAPAEGKPTTVETPVRPQPASKRLVGEAEWNRLLGQLEQAQIREAILKEELTLLQKRHADLMDKVGDLQAKLRAAEMSPPGATAPANRPGPAMSQGGMASRSTLSPAPRDADQELADLRQRVAALEGMVQQASGGGHSGTNPSASPDPFTKPVSSPQPSSVSEQPRRKKNELVIETYPVESLVSNASDVEPLTNIITRMIAADSWSGSGGRGSVVYFPRTKSLIVNQTREVHAQVRDLLMLLAIQQQAQSRTQGPTTTAPARR